MWQYNNPDELYHYGVLGMKWRMHKAAKKGQEYTYRSHGQRKYSKKVSKIESKLSNTQLSAKKTAKLKTELAKKNVKLDMYKTRDKDRQAFAKKTSVGKQIVKNVILGPIGSGGYNRARSAGYGRVASLLGSIYTPVIGTKIVENHTAKIKNKK